MIVYSVVDQRTIAAVQSFKGKADFFISFNLYAQAPICSCTSRYTTGICGLLKKEQLPACRCENCR